MGSAGSLENDAFAGEIGSSLRSARANFRAMSEHLHQAALFRWARTQVVLIPELALLFAIPNGGVRNKVTGWKLKQEGVTRGIPDICLPVARGGYHGLWIELKNDEPKGVVSAEQAAWITALRAEGYCALVCFGWDQARESISEYLSPLLKAA